MNQQLDQAIEQFGKVTEARQRYPRVPEALLHACLAHVEGRKPMQVARILDQLFESKAKAQPNKGSKLTEDNIRDIRRLGREGHSQMEIASRFGISQPYVWGILHRMNWAWVKEVDDDAL